MQGGIPALQSRNSTALQTWAGPDATTSGQPFWICRGHLEDGRTKAVSRLTAPVMFLRNGWLGSEATFALACSQTAGISHGAAIAAAPAGGVRLLIFGGGGCFASKKAANLRTHLQF